MTSRRKSRRGWVLRDAVLILTLVNYLTMAIGLPLPSFHFRSAQSSDIAYPCQDHACGCVSSEECWKGDCCCYTLEQKLAWAEARGVEPPSHVRTLVESRKTGIQKHGKKSCCSESTATDEHHPKGSICERDSTPCECERLAASTDQLNQTQSEATAVDGDKVEHAPLRLRWVVGILAQKCRGTGPSGLLQLEFTGLHQVSTFRSFQSPPDGWIVPGKMKTLEFAHIPPAPPPRRS
ncbi:hypothetical protein BH10PLA2_BH10PLA2_07290 [soil metagenome]